MHISRDVGLPIVKAFEGCLRPVPGRGGFFTTYYCPAGVLTIGWGHTNLGNVPPHISAGDVWSQKQCDDALAVGDMPKFEGRVDRIMQGVTLKQYEYDALISFDFNTGGLDKSSIPAKIRSGRRKEVAPTLARWNHANGRELAGLTRRRKSEGELFDGKADQALKTANAHRAYANTTGELMPQQTDRPTPPPAEVAKRAAPEIGTVATGTASTAGGAISKGTTQAPPPAAPAPPSGPAYSTAAIIVGVAIIAVGVVLLVRKYKIVDADWA